MMRLSSLIVCASILACAMAQTPTTTSTVPQPTPTTGPPVTELPPLPAKEYVFIDPHTNKTCIRMVADITAKFVYTDKTSGKPMSFNYSFADGADVDEGNSNCPANKLVLKYDLPEGGEPDSHYTTFSFMKLDGNAWTSETILYNFTVTEAAFPGSNYTGSTLSYTATNKLMDRNVDLGGSYQCNTTEDIKFDSSATKDQVSVTLEVVGLRVQAYFGDGKEEFGTVTDCTADGGSKGNKIVPIAVGAALAGLVIVVLIAYLIGRLKSRRQSSYEALS